MGIKSFTLSIIMILVSVLFWGYLFLFFSSVSLSHLGYLVFIWTVYLSTFLLFSILEGNKKFIYLILVLSGVGFFTFFFSREKTIFIPYLIGMLIFILLTILAAELILREKEQRLKISLKKIWKRGLPPFIAGLSLMISLVYYFNPLVKLQEEEIKIPPEVFGFILKPTAGIVGKIIPFYGPEMTIDETLASSLMLQNKGVKSNGIPLNLINKINSNSLEKLDINQLLQDQEIKKFIQEQVKTESVDQKLLAEQRRNLSQSLGIELKGDETMEVILASVINAQLARLIKPYAQIVSLGIVIVLFFVLKFVGNFLSIFSLIISHFIFYFLRLIKVVKIEQEMKSAQVIKF